MLSLVRRQLRRSLLYWILLSVFIRNHCGTGLARACNRSGQRSTQHNRVQQHGAEPPADCCSARKAPAAVQRHATYRFLFCALASVILVRKVLCDGMVSGGQPVVSDCTAASANLHDASHGSPFGLGASRVFTMPRAAAVWLPRQGPEWPENSVLLFFFSHYCARFDHVTQRSRPIFRGWRARWAPQLGQSMPESQIHPCAVTDRQLHARTALGSGWDLCWHGATRRGMALTRSTTSRGV